MQGFLPPCSICLRKRMKREAQSVLSGSEQRRNPASPLRPASLLPPLPLSAVPPAPPGSRGLWKGQPQKAAAALPVPGP